MAWLSSKIEQFKQNASARRNKSEHERAVVRTQTQIHEFWKQTIFDAEQHTSNYHWKQFLEALPHKLQDFLGTLEVPLKHYPRAEEVGLPLLQFYFLSSSNPQVEHALLAVGLEAGLPVTPQLCAFFVGACAMAPVGNIRNCHVEVPHKFLRCEYPEANKLLPFAYAVQYRQRDNPAWPFSEKYVQGAKLLEAFGANWRTTNSNGVPLGHELHACLHPNHRAHFEKFVHTPTRIDVNAIVDKRKAEQNAGVAKIKI